MSNSDPLLKIEEYMNQDPFPKDKKEIALWRQKEEALVERLREDLKVYHGLSDHPKEGQLWSLAWEIGHASGLADVVIYYGEISALLK